MYCGTSNIVLPVPNKSYYPVAYRNSSRLQYYATLFNSLEINQTFYKVPRAATFARWAEEAGPGFRFSVKLWKGITHVKDLMYKESDLLQFMHAISAFGNTRGCLLIQLPAGTRDTYYEKLAALIDTVALHNSGWKIAVEFRHVSWYRDRVWSLLENYRACLVEHDMPASATPAELPRSSFRFIRFHGVQGDYRGSYTDEQLSAHSEGIVHSESEGREVYAYFNNTLGSAVHNALSLQQMVNVRLNRSMETGRYI